MKHFAAPVALSLAIVLASCSEKTPEEHLVLHYDSPADFFDEALPIGNGRIGAMVYGGTSVDHLSLNDITLWTGEPDKGADHPDYAVIKELTPWGESAGWVETIRKTLEKGDYAEADRLQRHLQGHFSESYQPLGTLTIRYPEGEITDYRRELDISDAIAKVSYKRDGKAFETEYFVSSPDSVIVIRLHGEAPIEATVSINSLLPHDTGASGGMIISDGYAAWHAFPDYYGIDKRLQYDPDRGIHYRTVVSCDGAVAEGDSLRISGVTDALILVTDRTSFDGFDRPSKKPYQAPAVEGALAAAKKGVDALRERHLEDYHSYFDRVSIDLGKTAPEIKALPTDQQLLRYSDGESNPELEALYFQYGRYLLIASSRTEGVPANLQGLWNEYLMPPWSCNYTTNINLEENYWAAEAAALPEMHEVLLSFVRNLSVGGARSAKNYFGIDEGWCQAHNSDIWAMTCPVGLGTGDPSWANWYLGGAWLSTHIWEHWLFSRDEAALRRDWPALKGAAEFCIAALVEREGELVTSPATSPENVYVTPEGYHGRTSYGTTADLAIVRECITDAKNAAEILGDGEFASKAAAVLPRLRGYQVGADGGIQEWYYDWDDEDPRHRHQSHLIGVYPGHQIEAGSPLAEAALKTLEIKGFETTGWSCGWRVNLYARLGDGESAYKMYRRLLRYVSPDGYKGEDARRGGGTYPNLLDAHSPFQIDGNFGGCAGIIEMLIQSGPDGVTPLPALPSAWPSGSIKGIRTRTGQTADLTWENGKVKSFTLR